MGEEDPTTQELKVQQSRRAKAEAAAAEEAREGDFIGADEAADKHERRAEKSAYLKEKLEERARAEREASRED